MSSEAPSKKHHASYCLILKKWNISICSLKKKHKKDPTLFNFCGNSKSCFCSFPARAEGQERGGGSKTGRGQERGKTPGRREPQAQSGCVLLSIPVAPRPWARGHRRRHHLLLLCFELLISSSIIQTTSFYTTKG